MSKHTAGPWKVHLGFSDWGMPCQHDIFVGQNDEPDLLIASVPSITPYCMGALVKDREYAATQKANARLISAAPDLLDALQDAVTVLLAIDRNRVDDDVLRCSQLAIAKAEGRDEPA
ncbi:unnamed protein product [Sphagnum jensenii]